MRRRSRWDVRSASVAAQVGRFSAAWVCVSPAFLLVNLFLSYADFVSFALGLAGYQSLLPHFPVQTFFHVYVCVCMLITAILYLRAVLSVQVQLHWKSATQASNDSNSWPCSRNIKWGMLKTWEFSPRNREDKTCLWNKWLLNSPDLLSWSLAQGWWWWILGYNVHELNWQQLAKMLDH